MITQIYNQSDKKELLKKIDGRAGKNNINNAIIKAVFTRSMDSEWKYLIGKCEIGTIGENSESVYSNHAFICKSIDNFNLSEFLSSLEEGGYSVSEHMPPIAASTEHNSNWSEELIPSHANSHKTPVRKYSTKINDKSCFNDSILLGFGMDFHMSSGEYLKNFMDMRSFHGYSDARRGELSIEVTDHRGKICINDGSVSIDCKGVDACLVGLTPSQNRIHLKPSETCEISDKELHDAELWLITSENEILDFRSKTESQYEIGRIDGEQRIVEQHLEKIELGESPEVEFKPYIDISKKSNDKAYEIEKTVCAFSNAYGGALYIGVLDDGQIEGIDNKVRKYYKSELGEAIEAYKKDLGKRLRETLIDGQCFNIESMKLGKYYVVIISVARSPKPNFFLNPKKGYIRKGATSALMYPGEEREQDKRFNPFSLEGQGAS